MTEQTLIASRPLPAMNAGAQNFGTSPEGSAAGYGLGSGAGAAKRGVQTPSVWSELDGLLILDACGCVTFCSAAAAELLGMTSARLVGQQITRVIPELPFGRYTPEFNLAYVFFRGNDGIWTRRSLRTVDGRSVPVDVSLGTIPEVGERSIVLVIKQSENFAGMSATAGN